MRHAAIPLILALAGLAGPVLAQDAPGPPPPVIRPDDGVMTCVQMADEAGTISKALDDSDEGSMFGRFGGVLRQGAAMMIPGAGIVIAGADAMNQPEQERKQALVLNQVNRWYYLNGLYIGRDCGAASTTETVTPAAPTSPATPPPVAPQPTPVA